MSELHRIGEQVAASVADVVFVHGLGGDPFATWWHNPETPRDSWPFWLAEDLPEVAVHCLAYDASPSQWLGWSMPLVDRATNLLSRFEAERIGSRPLFFICHSLGGLVVKQMLRSALELGESDWRQVVDNTRGIVFLATPHAGARLADYLGALSKILRLSVSVRELEASAPALRDLNVWYRQRAKDLGIETLALFETRESHGVRVVDEASSDAGLGVARAMDADHFSICKPPTRSDLVYGTAKAFISRHLPTTSPTKTGAPGPEPAGQAFGTASASEQARFFISYSRRAAEDAELADLLQAGLQQAGHEVFIDRGIRVGTDWVAEIEHRMDWCDYLVVLLSEKSIHSEMVLGEVRMAHRKRREDGRPHILPVRVRYDGPLDYELDSYLARTQYTRWQTSADSELVLEEILGTADPSALRHLAENVAPFERPFDSTGRPQPSADVRRVTLAPPGGTIRLNDQFYIRRTADKITESNAELLGVTLAIKAPRQFGKSSLLTRYLANCQKYDKRLALIDFQLFTDRELDDYSTLLSRLAEELVRGFGLDSIDAPAIQTQANLTYFIEDFLLPQVQPPLSIAFDEVDRVLGRPYQNDFFSMLRFWHNRRADKPIWDPVDLALVIATEPYALIDSKDRSPFNVAVPVEPAAFDRAALDDLNQRYGGLLSRSDLDILHDLLGGHPFLTRLAFYRAGTEEVGSIAELEAKAAEPDGPFGDHLRAMLVLLQERQGLLPALRQVVARGTTPDNDAYYRLHGAGLVRRDDGRIKPANILYARFFKTLA